MEEAVLAIVKRSGVTEPFSRAKVLSGVRRACQGRPVDEDALALLSQQVEEEIRAKGTVEVSSHEVGLAILGPLQELDEVAYLRFASVYRSYASVDDFVAEIDRLRIDRALPSSDSSGMLREPSHPRKEDVREPDGLDAREPADGVERAEDSALF